MVVDVLGSCWWYDQPSVLARHTRMLHCPPVPTSSWMLCTDRPHFVVWLGWSIVFNSLRSSPLTPSPGSDTWRCNRVGLDASHSCFHAAAIHASSISPQGSTGTWVGIFFFFSSGCSRHLGSPLESAWRHLILCGVMQDGPVVFHCIPCQGKGGCFPP